MLLRRRIVSQYLTDNGTEKCIVLPPLFLNRESLEKQVRVEGFCAFLSVVNGIGGEQRVNQFLEEPSIPA